jgi:hypothetical protein
MLNRLFSAFLAVIFSLTTLPISSAFAQRANELPIPGTMVQLSQAFEPVLIKGLRIDPHNPFAFNFIVDTGHTKLNQKDPALKAESDKLIKYFLAAMTVPEKNLWVNLSPYEKDRMIAKDLGETELGSDMLAQDYILKQLTASLIYPEKELGKKFWDRVYAKAQQLHGASEIPVNTFNKVWIVADQSEVYENGNVAYVTKAHLKVMMEEDYLAKQKNGNSKPTAASQVIRDVIIPEIEKEVNNGKNFAPLRQMFYSMILATWYKMVLKDSLLAQLYGNQSKVKVGVNALDQTEKDKIFERYLKAYKKGVFNYIKDADATGQQAPRKYFSGGVDGAMLAENIKRTKILNLRVVPRNPSYEIRTTIYTQARRPFNEEIGNALDTIIDHLAIVEPSYNEEDGKYRFRLFKGQAGVITKDEKKRRALLRLVLLRMLSDLQHKREEYKSLQISYGLSSTKREVVYNLLIDEQIDRQSLHTDIMEWLTDKSRRDMAMHVPLQATLEMAKQYALASGWKYYLSQQVIRQPFTAFGQDLVSEVSEIRNYHLFSSAEVVTFNKLLQNNKDNKARADFYASYGATSMPLLVTQDGVDVFPVMKHADYKGFHLFVFEDGSSILYCVPEILKTVAFKYRIDWPYTIDKLARDVGTSARRIKMDNYLSFGLHYMDNSRLLTIKTESPFILYTVQEGDTLESLVKTFEVAPNGILFGQFGEFTYKRNYRPRKGDQVIIKRQGDAAMAAKKTEAIDIVQPVVDTTGISNLQLGVAFAVVATAATTAVVYSYLKQSSSQKPALEDLELLLDSDVANPEEMLSILKEVLVMDISKAKNTIQLAEKLFANLKYYEGHQDVLLYMFLVMARFEGSEKGLTRGLEPLSGLAEIRKDIIRKAILLKVFKTREEALERLNQILAGEGDYVPKFGVVRIPRGDAFSILITYDPLFKDIKLKANVYNDVVVNASVLQQFQQPFVQLKRILTADSAMLIKETQDTDILDTMPEIIEYFFSNFYAGLTNGSTRSAANAFAYLEKSLLAIAANRTNIKADVQELIKWMSFYVSGEELSKDELIEYIDTHPETDLLLANASHFFENVILEINGREVRLNELVQKHLYSNGALGELETRWIFSCIILTMQHFGVITVSNDKITNPGLKGGIDLDAAKMNMSVSKIGGGVSMQFDPALVEKIRKEGFEGVEFSIDSIAPISNLPLLLGV